jgi:hypothetical protein
VYVGSNREHLSYDHFHETMLRYILSQVTSSIDTPSRVQVSVGVHQYCFSSHFDSIVYFYILDIVVLAIRVHGLKSVLVDLLILALTMDTIYS